jgi:hypothetical protein
MARNIWPTTSSAAAEVLSNRPKRFREPGGMGRSAMVHRSCRICVQTCRNEPFGYPRMASLRRLNTEILGKFPCIETRKSEVPNRFAGKRRFSWTMCAVSARREDLIALVTSRLKEFCSRWFQERKWSLVRRTFLILRFKCANGSQDPNTRSTSARSTIDNLKTCCILFHASPTPGGSGRQFRRIPTET